MKKTNVKGKDYQVGEFERKLITLRYYEGLRIPEITAVLNVAPVIVDDYLRGIERRFDVGKNVLTRGEK